MSVFVTVLEAKVPAPIYLLNAPRCFSNSVLIVLEMGARRTTSL